MRGRIIAVLALVSTAALAVTFVVIGLSINSSVDILHNSAKGECVRANILREQLNTTHRTLHDLYKLFAQLSAQKHDARSQRFAKLFIAESHAVKYIPLTDCNSAVEHPLTYKPPHAQEFK